MRTQIVIAASAILCWVGAPASAMAAAGDLGRPPAQPAQLVAVTENDTCNMRQARRFIGMRYTSTLREQLARAILHNRIRLIRPGAVVTQELRPDRINLFLDDSGEIMTIRCG